MPTFPVWKMTATDYALCEQRQRSNEGNKLFAYRKSSKHPFVSAKRSSMWQTQSFPLKFTNHFEQNNIDS